MARIERYHGIVSQVLAKYAEIDLDSPNLKLVDLSDPDHDHYQLVFSGYENQRWMYGCFLHIDIKGGKIWVRHDSTEPGIIMELIELGVPKEDLLIGETIIE